MAFNKWMRSVINAGRALVNKQLSNSDKSPAVLSAELCSIKGEAVGVALADALIDAYEQLNNDEKLVYFQTLLSAYQPDAEKIIAAAKAYKSDQSLRNYQQLFSEVESPRKNLFQRINMSLRGIAMLVRLREDLQVYLSDHPELKLVDQDLQSLFTSWFNRGFLELRKIDWNSPADILEKLIAYEAVHAIKDWDDLRSRLEGDRTVYAFFHPLLENEPLIFVEVALVDGLANSVQAILDKTNQVEKPDTAIFYSISNCQKGLKGVSFGNFLIKQVVMELVEEYPDIKQFSTLSPIPGFMPWLKKSFATKALTKLCSVEELNIVRMIANQEWRLGITTPSKEILSTLTKLCSYYLYKEKRGDKPKDPVARFHLGNGACIERLNWMGDNSEKGMDQSVGFMVNYKYDLSRLEENHELYVNDNVIACSNEFLENMN